MCSRKKDDDRAISAIVYAGGRVRKWPLKARVVDAEWKIQPRPMRARPPKVVSLQIGDPFFAQQGRLLRGLDAFGDRAKAKTARQTQ